MAIHIQDYGMVASGARGGGMVPLQAADAVSLGASRLFDGTVDAVSGTAVLTDKIHRLKVLGERSEIRAGLERFHEETVSGFETRDDFENFSRDWNQAVMEKLPEYLPENLSSSAKDFLAEAILRLKEKGGIEIREMAYLGMVGKARSSWKSGMAESAARGDRFSLEKSMEEGSGMFVPVSEEKKYMRELEQTADDARVERESVSNPLVAIREIDTGKHPFSGSKDKALALKEKCGEQAIVVKEHLGAFYADKLLKGEPLDVESLFNAENRMFLKPEQVRNMLDGESKKRRETFEGVRFRVPEGDLCDWRRRLDERNATRAEEADILIALSTAGLPRRDFSSLYERFVKTASIPAELRKHVSRQLNALYRGGLWGCVGDESACKSWRDMQNAMMDAMIGDLSMTREKADVLIEAERKKQGASWVDFSSMKRKENKSGDNRRHGKENA